MRTAITKRAIESQLATRFGEAVFKLPDRLPAEVISTGIPELDAVTGGFPRGAITEIYGAESSGRTSLALSVMAYASAHDEVCALVDTSDVFDPKSAANAAVNLDRVLWIRCAGNLEHSFKAVDLLLQGGGFGLVALDLGDVQAQDARRIISSWWYRFRRVVENTPTALLVIARDSCVRSCASLTLALTSNKFIWSRSDESDLTSVDSLKDSTVKAARQNTRVTHGNILRSSSIEIQRIKPINFEPARIKFSI